MGLFVSNRHQLLVEGEMVPMIVRVGAAQFLKLCIDIGTMLHWLYAPTPQHFVAPLSNEFPPIGQAGIPGRGMRGKGQSTTRPYNAFKGGRYGSGMATQGMHIHAAMPASANLACQSRRLLWAA